RGHRGKREGRGKKEDENKPLIPIHPSPFTEEIKPAQAGFALRARYANVCVDAVSTARSTSLRCSPSKNLIT
ncbi:MAG: hypothetical protein ACRCT1_04330, partial [Microcoleaceae cyanobacterium]